MSPAQVTALLYSIKATRAEMPPGVARFGANIYRRLPVTHQAEWSGLGLPGGLLTEPMGTIRDAIAAANQKEVA